MLKSKVGRQGVKRMAAILAVVPESITLRLEANQGWSSKEAVKLIRPFEEFSYPIEFIKQPVKAWDLEGLKYVKGPCINTD